MAFPFWRISYSTNVHPAETLEEVRRMLAEEVAAVRDRFAPTERFGIELRLGSEAIAALRDASARKSFHAFLEAHGFFLFSINGFPLQPFHASRVKEAVYRPDWSEESRRDDTLALVEILADLLPEGETGSMSTLPLSYAGGSHESSFPERAGAHLATILLRLAEIEEERGKKILLAIEPEPFCLLDTCASFVAFSAAAKGKDDAFRGLREGAADERRQWLIQETAQALHSILAVMGCDPEAILSQYLGLCLDAAHLAVMFEDPHQVFLMLQRENISLPKIHVSAAARIYPAQHSGEAWSEWERLAEERYLHQTVAVDARGNIVFQAEDLPRLFALPLALRQTFQEVRTHFHLPLALSFEGIAGWMPTVDLTERLLHEVQQFSLSPALVVETYTWPLLTEGNREVIREGLAAELRWTAERATFLTRAPTTSSLDTTIGHPVKLSEEGDDISCNER